LGSITPSPYLARAGKGSFDVTEGSAVYFDESLENEAEYFVESFNQHFSVKLEKKEGQGGPGSISLVAAPVSVNGVSGEAYRLSIDSRQGIRITGNDPAGVFYGIQSLLSLVPASSFGSDLSLVTLPEAVIEDSPRFSYRGFLLDVSRNFHTKESVLKLIDLLALYKVNLLNLRLTEDEAWRLEIEGLPELTQVGSRRGHTLDDSEWLPPSFGSGPYPDAKGNLGTGYYTREDFKEIITYAANRHIRIVPEVCFPSHARAAIISMEARYRNYMEQGKREAAEEFRLVDPDDQSVYTSAQRYTDNIVCVANESTYHFYETVINDIRIMYEEAGLKLEIFHTGGDEVPVGAWAGSPLCQELMNSHPEIENPRHLHAYFVEKTLDMLEKYDLIVTGWEEAVLNKDNEGNISINPDFVGRNIMPLVWDNTGSNMDLGYRIANAGYPIIICNVTNLYFDLAYTTDPREPGLYWGGFQDAMDPYVLVPFDVFKSTIYDDYGRFNAQPVIPEGMERLLPENRKNIVGLQAQLWSETLKGHMMLEYYLLPKLFAFAEKAWSRAPEWESEADDRIRIRKVQSGWNLLANRIGQFEFNRLERIFGGSNFRIPAPGAIIENGKLHANTAFPGLIIRYTTDGSDPDSNAPIYQSPVEVSGSIKLRAFTPGGRAGWITEVK
jgi:hexosaminidase